MLRLPFLFLAIALPLAAFAQPQTKRVLFLGNSYTYYNSYAVATVLQQFAQYHGHTVIYDSNAPGGYTFQGHSTNATSLTKIRQGNWDYVVLQEQSQLPSFPPSQVAAQVYPYAAALNDTIEKYNPCAETVFFMTWGRKNGDASNCANYAPLCTYYGMQERLRTSYLEMSVDNQAICAPVGAAWQLVRSTYPDIELYIADESHPNYAGSYLAASVFYATLFRQSPENIPHYGTLADTVAQRLQWAAAQVVLDSIDLWHILDYDVMADFQSVASNGSVAFTNGSAFAQQYIWNFGDGATSTDSDPSHSYTADGHYTVQLIAMDTCGRADTTSQVVVMECVSPPTVTAGFSFVMGTDTVFFSNESSDAVAYFWDFGDGQTSVDASPVHVFSLGDFTVTLIATDSCGRADTTSQLFSFVPNASHPVASAIDLQIAPNPATDGQFTLRASALVERLRVLDYLGQTWLVYTPQSTEGQFLLPNAAGMYILVVETSKGIFRQTIVRP